MQGTSDQVLQAKQAAEQAAVAAAEAAAASSRCQQQVLELRGRQGQAERRLDTLWQLQVLLPCCNPHLELSCSAQLTVSVPVSACQYTTVSARSERRCKAKASVECHSRCICICMHAVNCLCRHQVCHICQHEIQSCVSLQEAAGENQAALARLQQDVQQTQQQLQQQQHNMAAMQAQIHQLSSRSKTDAIAGKQLETIVEELQQQVNTVSRKLRGCLRHTQDRCNRHCAWRAVPGLWDNLFSWGVPPGCPCLLSLY